MSIAKRQRSGHSPKHLSPGYLTMLGFLATSHIAFAQHISENYELDWDVFDSGGGTMTSENFVVTDSVGQDVIGDSLSANYIFSAGFHTAPDSDADLVKDFMDNCTFDPNPSQYDSNSDGFGNLCDADLNGDLQINFADLQLVKDAFFSNPSTPNWNPDADINGDDAVNFADLSFVRLAFFGVPGPSGIAP